MAFIEKRSDIQQLVLSSTPSPLMIQDLVIELVKINCIMNKLEVVNTLRRIYDKHSGIACELIVYAVDNIVNDALHEK
ncbi:hypothetical protein ALC57_06473 [Trachymyrmex cornetzi]|uniref:Uncharacterized protein n=1 Tax=Trachymyrmex cornetzi TaxID=471704 RepID=A0A151J8H9_9HYME|nr:hypothetical protein ALC57_06473 [Trachymyrmex cornetzi]